MHKSLLLLEEAISIAEKEEQALLESDLDLADVLFEKRSLLEKEAWESREGCEESALLSLYKKLQTLQLELERIARADFESVKESLAKTKKQNKYFSLSNNKPYADNKIHLFSKDL